MCIRDSPTTLKLFKDGTLEDYSSLMFENFSDHSGEGVEILDNDHMMAIARAAADKGFNLHTHAIGDKAISETLDPVSYTHLDVYKRQRAGSAAQGTGLL